jgi:hypothetical protein
MAKRMAKAISATKSPKATSKSKPMPSAGAKAKSGAGTTRPTAKGASRPLDEWRAAILAEVRRLILDADPDIVEERKWIKASNPAGVPVWSHAGIVCTGETYKQVVKLTFARGASLEDPNGLFNSSLDGNTRRAIDIQEGEALDAEAFKALIQAAVAENLRGSVAKSKPSPKEVSKAKPASSKAKTTRLQKNEQGVVLLSGGNPQIAKADGDAPVQAYIAAMPGWKSELGKRIDAIIVRSVPNVRKAVKWNSPFYGIEGQGWFASFHVFARYVKLTFFRGAALQPIPPGVGKDKDGRWIDLYEHDQLNEKQLTAWMKQAAAMPGWIP